MDSSTFLLIFVALLVLGSFFVAYMASKTWRVPQVILLALVFLASIVFWYLAARTLKTQAAWRALAVQAEKEVAQLQQEQEELLEGIPAAPEGSPLGINQIKHQLHRIALDRGAAWRGATKEKVDAQTGKVELTIKSPEPHGLSEKMAVFLFEEKKALDGGRYLGEFQATKADDKSAAVELTENLPLTAAQRERLAASEGSWTLYAIMPLDDPQALAALNEEARKEVLPPEHADLADIRRALHDYELFFRHQHSHRQLIADAMAALAADLQTAQNGLAHTEKESQYRTDEKNKLAADLGKFRGELNLVSAYRKRLAAELDGAKKELQNVLSATRRLAAQFASLQLEAAKEIDRRTATD